MKNTIIFFDNYKEYLQSINIFQEYLKSINYKYFDCDTDYYKSSKSMYLSGTKEKPITICGDCVKCSFNHDCTGYLIRKNKITCKQHIRENKLKRILKWIINLKLVMK